MENVEPFRAAGEIELESDYGKPLLVDWMDSDWFQVWLKLARREQPASA